MLFVFHKNYYFKTEFHLLLGKGSRVSHRPPTLSESNSEGERPVKGRVTGPLCAASHVSCAVALVLVDRMRSGAIALLLVTAPVTAFSEETARGNRAQNGCAE